MDCWVTSDVAGFAERVTPFLSGRPVEHNVILTLLTGRVGGQVVDTTPPACACAVDHGEVVGVTLRTPPWKTNLSVMPPAATVALEEALWDADPKAPAVSGPVRAARLFAERRAARTGRPARPGMSQRMYALTQVIPPTVPGRAAVAGPELMPMLARWWRSFAAEAVPNDPTGDVEQAIRVRMHGGGLLLWYDGDRPVSMAGYLGPRFGVARVGPVYTPPEYRRRGYGAAVTAACTACALDRGADTVMLYTDLANPSSNAIYQRIGYRPVTDAAEFHLD